MSKGPTPRHSKSPKPVTIDLDATDVTPKNEDLKPKTAAAGSDASKSSTPKTSVPNTSTSKTSETTEPGKDSHAAAATANASASSAKPASEPSSAEKAEADKAAAEKVAGKPGVDPRSAQTSASAKTADPKSKDPNPTSTAGRPAPSSAKSGGGGFGIVASGLIGAVIALGGGYALQAGGILPAPAGGGDQVQTLTTRLDAVSTELETVKSRMSDSAATGGTAISPEWTERLDSLETRLAEVTANSGGSAEGSSVLTGFDERIAALETQISGLEAGGNGSADPAMVSAVNELRASLSGLQSAVDELQTQTTSQTSDLSAKITEIEQSQSDMAQQLDEPSRQVDLARAIAASGLKSAIDRGGSFMSELEAFASVAPEDPAIPELRELAASGVPSRSRLIEQFPDAATTAIKAADPGNPDSGLVDRLMSSAMSVVKVRQVGDVEGDSAEAITARAEARLIDGDLDAALAEWNSLPEVSRDAASSYGEALAARARAEKLIAASLTPRSAAASPAAPAE